MLVKLSFDGNGPGELSCIWSWQKPCFWALHSVTAVFFIFLIEHLEVKKIKTYMK